jgi:hypothetical protein
MCCNMMGVSRENKQMNMEDAVQIALPVYRFKQEFGGIAGLAKRVGVHRSTLWLACRDAHNAQKNGPGASTHRATTNAHEDESEVG